MTEIRMHYSADGIYFCIGKRRRKITSNQATRILNLLWQQSGWKVEAIHVMERESRK